MWPHWCNSISVGEEDDEEGDRGGLSGYLWGLCVIDGQCAFSSLCPLSGCCTNALCTDNDDPPELCLVSEDGNDYPRSMCSNYTDEILNPLLEGPFPKPNDGICEPVSGGQVCQDSVDYGGYPSKAFDGNDDPYCGIFMGCSTTHTKSSADAYWQLELNTPIFVHQIRYVNRAVVATERLDGVIIEFFNASYVRLAAFPQGTDLVDETVIFAEGGVDNVSFIRFSWGAGNTEEHILSLAEVTVTTKVDGAVVVLP